MDRQLLVHALGKLNEEEAKTVLSRAGLLFQMRGAWFQRVDGQFVGPDGAVTDGNIGEITNVRLLQEVDSPTASEFDVPEIASDRLSSSGLQHMSVAQTHMAPDDLPRSSVGRREIPRMPEPPITQASIQKQQNDKRERTQASAKARAQQQQAQDLTGSGPLPAGAVVGENAPVGGLQAGTIGTQTRQVTQLGSGVEGDVRVVNRDGTETPLADVSSVHPNMRAHAQSTAAGVGHTRDVVTQDGTQAVSSIRQVNGPVVASGSAGKLPEATGPVAGDVSQVAKQAAPVGDQKAPAGGSASTPKK